MHLRKRMRNLSYVMVVALLVGASATTSLATSARPVASLQGAVTIGNTTDYDWWYGCSPTAAGMIIGHYDRNGYDGMDYSNLVPGGVAEDSTFGIPGQEFLVNGIIASQGHIDDFYSDGYLASGDDVLTGVHEFDSLADFMGTSQDALGHVNGTTSFWTYTNGYALSIADIVGHGLQDESGMYGIYEYLRYSGYGSPDPSTVTNIYNQRIAGYDEALQGDRGFTFADYMAEIDAGRPVMIHVEGHSMYGYGYEAADNEILLHDTWYIGEDRMVWGGSYAGMAHYGVTVVELTNGSLEAQQAVVPEPITMIGLFGGIMGVSAYIRKRRADGGLDA